MEKILTHRPNIPIGFFDDNTFETINDLFEPYIKAKRFGNKYTGNFGLSTQKISFSRDVIEKLGIINSISSIDQKFALNNNGINYAFGLMPQLSSSETVSGFNKKNQNNFFEIILPKGDNEYMIAQAKLEAFENEGKVGFEITSLKTTTNVFLSNDATIYRTSANKLIGGVMTLDANGNRVIANADYDYIFERMAEANIESKRFNITPDDTLLKIAASAGFQSSDKNNSLKDIFNITQIQTPNAIRNGIINESSKKFAISGSDLKSVLSGDASLLADENISYLLDFDSSGKNVIGITPYSVNKETGKFYDLSKEFKNISQIKDETEAGTLNTIKNNIDSMLSSDNKKYLSRDLLAEKVGYSESKFRASLTPEEVVKYDKRIMDLHKKGEASLSASYELANEIVQNEQMKILNAYGMTEILQKEKPDLNSASDYINAFNEYAARNGSLKNISKIKDYMNNQFNIGELALNIQLGHLLDDYGDVGKQSAVQTGKIRFISQADFITPFGHANTDLQRKAQAGDVYQKAVVMHNGEEINISAKFREFFSSIDEMHYKKNQLQYLQGEELIKKYSEKADIKVPIVNETQAKMLYTNTDLAYQDSDMFTNSFSLQNISMLNNKDTISVSYGSLNSNVFGDASPEEIKDFINQLEKNGYDLNKVKTASGIENNFIKNLLGEENYNKYLLGQSQDFITDLNEMGKEIKQIKSISDNKRAYIKASSEVTGKFNNWMNKYFFRSDSSATIGIINPNVVNSGTTTHLTGSNFGFIEGIDFDDKGINIRTKQLVVQGDGAKVMLDNIKATTQGFADLLAIKDADGIEHYFEAIVNEKMTKGSRGFSGTFFARSIITMVNNAMMGQLADGSDILADGTIDYQARFNNFKNIMSNIKIPLAPNITSDGQQLKGTYSIFDLFNIDIRYDNETGKIIFDDKNVQEALDFLDKSSDIEKQYVGFDARIREASRNNLKKIFSRKFVADEDAEIIGTFVSDFLYSGYDKVLASMTEQSKKEQQIAFENVDVLKSYISGDDVGMTKVNHASTAYLFTSQISMMNETKKRADTNGLKIGRLTELIASETNFQQLVDFINQKSTVEGAQQFVDYFSLAAIEGTEFARGGEIFNKTFTNTIDMLEKDFKYHTAGTNLDVSQYLSDSPLGRLMKFDSKNGRLEESVKGVITGFSHKYIEDLKSFFEESNKINVTSEASGMHILAIMDILKKNNTEIDKKHKVFKSLREKAFKQMQETGLNINYDIYLKENTNILNANEVKKAYKTNIISLLNKVAETNEEKEMVANIKKLIDDTKFTKYGDIEELISSAINFEVGFNNLFLTEPERILYKNPVNLNKNLISELKYNYSKELGTFGSILSGIFDNADNISNEDLYFNLSELRQISKFGNIPFIIDSMAADANGMIVPNKTLSMLEKIMRTNAELVALEKVSQRFGNGYFENSEKIFKAISSEKNPKYTTYNKSINDIKQKVINSFYDKGIDLNIKRVDGYLNKFYEKTYLTDDIDATQLLTLDNKTLFNIFKDVDSNNVTTEIKVKFAEFIENLKYSGSSSASNLLIRNTTGTSNNVYSSVIEKIVKGSTGFAELNEDLNKYILAIKSNKNDQVTVDEIKRFQNDLYDFIGNEFRKMIEPFVGTRDEIINYLFKFNNVDKLNNVQTGEFEKELFNLLKGFGITEEQKELFKVLQTTLMTDKSVKTKIQNGISSKRRNLINLFINRNKHLSQQLFAKGGVFYELGSFSLKESSAFSPREGSVITSYIAEELKDIIKNRKFVNGQIRDTKEFIDFKKAIKLVYGNDYTDDVLEKINLAYNSGDLNGIKEIKDKLDSFSNIVIGDRKMMRKIGKEHLFKNIKDKRIYGLLSRNPHQYKNSVTPSMFVMISEQDKQLSFLGKMFGTGNTVDSTQSNLYFIGKRTALGANGDFDGDTFQAMFIGLKDLDYLKYYDEMKPQQFLKEYKAKLRVYNMLNNMDEDLEAIFNNSSVLTGRHKILKDYIASAYFGGAKVETITNEDAYKAIEDTHLSLAHERGRVLAKYEDELAEHANMPKIGGFFEYRNNQKLSKQTLSNFLMTIDQYNAGLIYTGQMNKDQLRLIIERAPEEIRGELLSAFQHEDGNYLLKLLHENPIIENSSKHLSWRGLFDDINKFLADAGSAKTGKVHSKISSYREVSSALSNKSNMEMFLKRLKLNEDANIVNNPLFNPVLIHRATSANNFGELIEKLAISAKKGVTDPSKKLAMFDATREAAKLKIGKIGIVYNFEHMANFTYGLNKKYASQGNAADISEFLNKNFDEWFKEMFTTDIELTNQKDINKYNAIIDDLKRNFLGLNDIDYDKLVDRANKLGLKNIDELSVGQVLAKDTKDGVKALSLFKLKEAISNWNSIIHRSESEKTLGIDDISEGVYKKTFKNYTKSFVRNMANLLEVLKNPEENTDVRSQTRRLSSIYEIFFKKVTEASAEAVTENTEELTQEAVEVAKKAVAQNISEPNSENIAEAIEPIVEETKKQAAKELKKIEKAKKRAERKGKINPNQMTIDFENAPTEIIGEQTSLNFDVTEEVEDVSIKFDEETVRAERTRGMNSPNNMNEELSRKKEEVFNNNKNSSRTYANEIVDRQRDYNRTTEGRPNIEAPDIKVNTSNTAVDEILKQQELNDEFNSYRNKSLEEAIEINNAKINELEKELSENQNKILSLNKQSETFVEDRKALEQTIKELQDNIEALKKEIEVSKSSYEEAIANNTALNEKIAELNDKLDQNTSEYNEVIQKNNKLEQDAVKLNEQINSTTEQLNETINQKQKLEQEISELNGQINENTKAYDDAVKRSEALEGQINDLNKQLNEAAETSSTSINQNKKLEEEVSALKTELESLKRTYQSSMDKNKELQSKIETLEQRIQKAKFEYTKLKNLKDNAVQKIQDVSQKGKAFTRRTIENVTSEEVAQKISKYKGKIALAGGAVALLSFFRIFQKSRPVVNLDINEQEYERSQGSIYRNLGQYTMNTNIRSLY